MNALILIYNDGLGNRSVDARELYDFLQVKRDFSTWITGRIKEYSFVAEIDFTTILGKSSGGRPSKEYHLSIDMAKELSMVERNEQGRKARIYFIRCQEELLKRNVVEAVQIPQTMAEALQLAADQAKKIEEMAPIVQYAKDMSECEQVFTTTILAKKLNVSAIKLNLFLNDHNIIFKQSGVWLPFARYQDKGYCKIKTWLVRDDNGGPQQLKPNLKWTPKGWEFIHKLWYKFNKQEIVEYQPEFFEV